MVEHFERERRKSSFYNIITDLLFKETQVWLYY